MQAFDVTVESPGSGKLETCQPIQPLRLPCHLRAHMVFFCSPSLMIPKQEDYIAAHPRRRFEGDHQDSHN